MVTFTRAKAQLAWCGSVDVDGQKDGPGAADPAPDATATVRDLSWSMPRLHSSLLRRAASENVLLARLLPECRDLVSARNELRWLREHAWNKCITCSNDTRSRALTQRLIRFVHRRSRGEPLQYILGSQPFGNLEILCRRHVLIPRPETELYTTHVAQLLLGACADGMFDARRELRIVDLCTGTGCVPLLLHAILRASSATLSFGSPAKKILQEGALTILGVDLSNHALKLATDNLDHNLKQGCLRDIVQDEVTWQHLNVLELGRSASESVSDLAAHGPASIFLRQSWPVIISNPPYISLADYAPGGTTTRSVRDYEPKLALVPPPLPSSPSVHAASSALKDSRAHVQQADQFYDAILKIASIVDTELLVMEIGDSAQASRVRALAVERFSSDVGGADVDRPVVETWRDDGSVDVYHDAIQTQRNVDDADGERAHERAVVIWKDQLARWRTQQAAYDRSM